LQDSFDVTSDEHVFHETSKKMIYVVIALYFVSLFVGAFIFSDLASLVPFAKGLTLGTMFSVLKVYLLSKTLKKAISLEPANARNYARLHYTLRFLLTGVILAVSALEPSISFLGTCIGMLTLQIAAYSTNFLISSQKK